MSFITCPNCKRKTDTSYLWRCHYCGAAVADPNEPIGHKKAMNHSDPNQYLKDLEQKVREARELLAEAETSLKHTACIDDDAMRCHGCSLEFRISEFLSERNK